MRILTLLAAALLAICITAPRCALASSPEEAANLGRASQIFDAFAKGDIPAFLDMLSDDVYWRVYGFEDVMTLHGELHGKAAVTDWFGKIAATFNETEFGPDELYADGDTVIIIGHEAGTVIATGTPYSEHWAAFITFSGDKIVSFRLFDDSGQEAKALGLVK